MFVGSDNPFHFESVYQRWAVHDDFSFSLQLLEVCKSTLAAKVQALQVFIWLRSTCLRTLPACPYSGTDLTKHNQTLSNVGEQPVSGRRYSRQQEEYVLSHPRRCRTSS